MILDQFSYPCNAILCCEIRKRGPGDTVVAGYVELHMENMGDNVALGLPSDVVVRRTVGMKKDEYLLNNKRADLNDVINLFETIGFSRCNPYNIVLQGQVDALTAMSAEDRLELVKDIAGASLYDDKKADSLKLLDETEGKMQKVGEVIESLAQRIGDLEIEKDDLTKFQETDKRRRALEYRIRELESVSVEQQIQSLEGDHATIAAQSASLHKEMSEYQDQLETEHIKLRDLQVKREMQERQRDEVSADYTQLVGRVARLQLEIEEAKQSIADDPARERKVTAERAELVKEVAKHESALKKATAAYEAAQVEESSIKKTYEEGERRARELYAKQGRIAKYSTKKERDLALDTELRKLSDAKEARLKQTTALESDIAALSNTVAVLESQIKDRENRHAELMKRVQELTESYTVAKNRRDEFADQRKAQWQEQRTKEEECVSKRNQLAHYEKQLYSTLGRELVAGIDAVKKQADQRGIYGPLIELIDLPDPSLAPAIEAAAGNSLFHIVVDNDETAQRVLTELHRTRSGRVTCIPLTKVPANVGNLIADVGAHLLKNGTHAAPLLNHISPKVGTYQPALNQVFGKILICDSIELASQLAPEYGLRCVTNDGAQVNPKGAMTGGYVDERTSRIKISREMVNLKASLIAFEARIAELKISLDKLEGRITSGIQEMAKLEKTRAEEIHKFETFAETSRAAHRELLNTREVLMKRVNANAENNAQLEALESSIEALHSEKSSKQLFTKLSDAESEDLVNWNRENESISRQLTEATQKRAKCEIEKSELEARLSGKLLPQLVDYDDQLAKLKMRPFIASKDTMQTSEALDNELQTAESQLDRAKRLSDQLEAESEKTRSDIKESQQKIDDLTTRLNGVRLRAIQVSELLDGNFNSKATILAKRDELNKRIREISSLPSKESEEVAKLTLRESQKALSDAKKTLASFEGINQKSLDQYVLFSEEKQKFEDRRDLMQKEKSAIEDLISQLDLQKDDAIMRTFRGIAKKFKQKFVEICPDGDADLVLRQREVEAEEEDEDEEKDSEDDEQQNQTSRSKSASMKKTTTTQFIGIDMRVSFNKKGSKTEYKEGAKIRQLSGGQRTITSLSLIFAIQESDRAPFYIFDEIDPALDDRYRSKIAEMIKKASSENQFLIVTHRPEMVREAHKNYVISFSNRSSEVSAVDEYTALEVVAQAEKQAENEFSRQSTSRKKKATRADKTASTEDSEIIAAASTRTRRPSRGAVEEENEDDDEMIVRFNRPSNRDEEPNPFTATEDDTLLDTPSARPKRGRTE